MQLKKININDDILVKLTPQGLAYYRANPWGATKPKKYRSYYILQLWVFMKVFGPLIRMGLEVGKYFSLNVAFREEDLK